MKARIVPEVSGALGTMPKFLEMRLNQLEISGKSKLSRP